MYILYANIVVVRDESRLQPRCGSLHNQPNFSEARPANVDSSTTSQMISGTSDSCRTQRGKRLVKGVAFMDL